MKTRKILLATTALCMAAGTAVADITLSGEAEMGVAGSKDDSVRFHTDIDVTFTLSGETDGGVTFGSAIDIDEASDDLKRNAAGTETVDHATQKDDEHGGIAVFMEDAGGFGKLTLGDTDGAYDWALTEVNAGGLRSEGEHGGWDGNSGLDGNHDGQILLYNRAIGSGFSMGASVELSDDTDGKPGGKTYDPIIGLGGTYSMGMGAGTLDLGGGFQTGSWDHTVAKSVAQQRRDAGLSFADARLATPALTTDQKNEVKPLWGTGMGSDAKGLEVEGTVVGGSAKMGFGDAAAGGSWTVILNGSVMEADGSALIGTTRNSETLDVEKTYLGLGLGYSVGSLSLGVNVGNKVTESTYDESNATTATNDVTTIETTVNGVGFDVAYDLGGGASLMFGVGSSETETDYAYGTSAEGYATGANNATSSVTDDTSTDTNKWSLGVKFKF